MTGIVERHEVRPYESPAMRASVGDAIRPGGTQLTVRALGGCRFASGERVLDVGCGLGVTVELMRTRYRLDAVGVDSSEAMIARARSRAAGLPLTVADARRLPFADAEFHGATMECVLSVVEDAQAALAEAHRVLKPGGRLIVSDLYRRDSSGAPDPAAGCSCLAGARDRETTTGRLLAAGFRMVLWEDHTALLKQLAADLIMRHGSLQCFWEAVLSGTESAAAPGPADYRRLGYYLAIAERPAGQ